jgi:Domain of unknown function (DUF222)
MFVYDSGVTEAGVHTFEELVDVDSTMLCDSEIRAAYVGARGMIDRLEAAAARLLAAAHHRTIPLGEGASSTPAWSQAQTGQRYSDAKATLEAGLGCESLPLTAKAWAQGEISASAARTICRGQRAGHEDVYASIEATLVDYAVGRDFRGLDAMIRHYQTRADALDDVEAADRNHVHLSHSGNRWVLDGDLDELAGATVDEAIRAATDQPSEGDDRSAAKRRADALSRICRFFLDHAGLPVEGGEVPHVSIVVSWETLRDRLPPTVSDVALGPADVSRLLCEANVSRIVVGPDRVPLDVGRATRNPSRALRRALTVRDQGCRFPGCDRRPSWCQTHHVVPWFPDGETKLDNLVLLCDFHHHVVHKPGWTATFDGVTFEVTNPDGRLIGAS